MENERIARLEECANTMKDKVNSIELKIESIFELAISVKEIANEIKLMRVDLNKIDKRVNTLEYKPAKKWEHLVQTLTASVITAIIGYLVAKVR